MKLLILNCYSRNALAVIDALDRSYELWGGSNRNNNFFITNPDRWFRSSRLAGVIRHGGPGISGRAWAEELARICRDQRIDGIIPTGTTTTDLLSQFKPLIEDSSPAKCLVENFELLGRVTDKWHTYELCQEAGVPTPKSARIRRNRDAVDLAREFRFPVVVKPHLSYASIGVRFFFRPDELVDWTSNGSAENAESSRDYVLQERIDGELHDVTSFSFKGQVKALLTQQRMVSLYDWGGGGIINKTTHEPASMELAEKFLRHAGWSGVLVFDFIRDRKTGEFFLLECNPKFWGTTDLTIKAGFNVAQMTVDHFLLGKEWPRSHTYEQGLLYKWWVPECLYHWVHRPRSPRLVFRRMARTFRNYGATRAVNNLRWRNLPHLLGIVFDRAQL